MTVYKDIEHLPGFRNAVVTIGTFDGVHLGHQQIINQLRAEAERVNGETVIITFHPHPRKIVREHANTVQLLTTVEERAELMRKAGVDNLVIVPFTKGFSDVVPKKYIEDFLYARFKPAVVIIGYDHRFGKDRQGDYKLLEEYSAKGLFTLKEIPQHLINDSTVSSTRIRSALNQGDVELAAKLLGFDFFFEGIVIRGDQRGRTIGYPTANLQVVNEDKIIPANGVYAVRIDINNEHHSGMMNIGVRPTVDGTRQTIEVNIFNFAKDIYGTTVRVHVKSFIREEKKFSSLDELKARLAIDRELSVKAMSQAGNLQG